MKIKDIVDVDFVNYKVPSMFIIFPTCTFKCDLENKCQCCQNMPISKQPDIKISYDTIVNRYINNDITHAIIFGGLEPLDSWPDTYKLIGEFRKFTSDPIILYTGYTELESSKKIEALKVFDNIIIKFGRYRPDQVKHYDDILGIYLASDNQYAKKIC